MNPPAVKAGLFLLLVVATTMPGPRAGSDHRAGLEERIASRRAIEEVYWRHRIWPASNPRPKPDLAEVMPDSAIRPRVLDDLRKVAALGAIWGRPITGEQLQAEMNRMVSGSKAPAALGEIEATLGNDPARVAESLALPVLADRLARSWYAHDGRFHVALRRQAEAAVVGARTVADARRQGGDYAETEFVREVSASGAAAHREGAASVNLAEDEWERLIERVAAGFDVAPGDVGHGEGASSLLARLPILTLSALQEDGDRFYVQTILDAGPARLRLAAVSWTKRTFDDWWAEARRGLAPAEGAPPYDYRLPALASSSCGDDTWAPTHDDFPRDRAHHTAVWTGNEMIVWGGNTFTGPVSSGERYDPATDTWRTLGTDPGSPSARNGHVAVWTGTEMIVWGGQDASFQPTNSGGRYDPVADAWTPTKLDATTPAGRSGSTAVWTGSVMIVWGGQVSGSSCLNSGGRYDPSTDTWSATRADVTTPGGRIGHTAVWTGSVMVVWGGETCSGSQVASGGRYSPASDSWTPTRSDATTPVARGEHTAVWTGTTMIVWGGQFRDVQGLIFQVNTGGRYDPSADTWMATRADATAPAGRIRHTAIWSGSEMIVWGGGTSIAFNSGGRYNPVADSWIPTRSDASAPDARADHTAVWTGTEMIVFGGGSGVSFYLNTGGRYDPATDTWVPTSADTILHERNSHSAVWTGSEMIVWGGVASGYMNTGGRYDPAIDSWTPTRSDATTPGPRASHTAVWTGTEMIVWGGSMGAYLNSGGRYNPMTDTWVAIRADTMTPEARAYHTAVWTGSEMIVWGGALNGALNTGGRYDPLADTWTATRTDSTTPGGRLRHTAVWTGSEMIVWGGQDTSSTVTASGGRYTPASDSWSFTRPDTAPEARAFHTAVWTGSEMIIWGGLRQQQIPGGLVNTGGRYRPGNDTWTPTRSDATAPQPRFSHTAVWTGKEMIIWGGAGYTTFQFDLNSGARYDPGADAWRPTLLDGTTPSPRSRHSSIWTGHEMVVWGGGNSLKSGGRYCVCVPTVFYRDVDGDGVGDSSSILMSCVQPAGYAAVGGDCNDADPGVWGVPGEVRDLQLADATSLNWSAPASPGALVVLYDALRSTSPSNFVAAATCVASNSAGRSATETATPPAGSIFFYLVRAENSCPGGQGPLGSNSSGVV